jgi:hypothetical protein
VAQQNQLVPNDEVMEWIRWRLDLMSKHPHLHAPLLRAHQEWLKGAFDPQRIAFIKNAVHLMQMLEGTYVPSNSKSRIHSKSGTKKGAAALRKYAINMVMCLLVARQAILEGQEASGATCKRLGLESAPAWVRDCRTLRPPADNEKAWWVVAQKVLHENVLDAVYMDYLAEVAKQKRQGTEDLSFKRYVRPYNLTLKNQLGSKAKYFELDSVVVEQEHPTENTMRPVGTRKAIMDGDRILSKLHRTFASVIKELE